jgi:hypothetical protein
LGKQVARPAGEGDVPLACTVRVQPAVTQRRNKRVSQRAGTAARRADTQRVCVCGGGGGGQRAACTVSPASRDPLGRPETHSPCARTTKQVGEREVAEWGEQRSPTRGRRGRLAGLSVDSRAHFWSHLILSVLTTAAAVATKIRAKAYLRVGAQHIRR